MDIHVGQRYVIDCGMGKETARVTGIVGPGLYEGEFYVTLENHGGFPGIVERSEFVSEVTDA